MNLKALLLAGAIVAAVVTPIASPAQSDTKILTVSGSIGKTNTPDHKAYVFTFADLQKLGNTPIKSTTTWVGSAEFSGPKIRDILKAVAAAPGAKEVVVVSIDGYQKAIPIDDFSKWEVIAAHSQNGKRLTVETMLGFKSFWSAAKIISGIETMHMIKKGQMTCPESQVMSAAHQFYSLAA
jgi:hypothetical protein